MLLLGGGGACSTFLKFNEVSLKKYYFSGETAFLGQSSLPTHLPLFSNFTSKKKKKKCKDKLSKTGEKSHGKSMFFGEF